jgi:2-amino-4-hydroxy-6-hydroxymethyldihydropteridine diphosphokinase
MAGVAYVGIGSNVGDAFEHCLKGIREVLEDERALFLALSSFYLTSPVSPIAQSDFLNSVLKVRWEGSAPELLSHLQAVEARLGRERKVRFGPRTLDLDILLYDDLILDTPGLTIPHPRLHERKFVLVPCLEIDPGLVHPRLKRPLGECLGLIGPEQEIGFFAKVTRGQVLAGRTRQSGREGGDLR